MNRKHKKQKKIRLPSDAFTFASLGLAAASGNGSDVVRLLDYIHGNSVTVDRPKKKPSK